MENNNADTDLGLIPVPIVAITLEQMMVRLGETILALLLGEILHRIILIFEELPHVKERSYIIFNPDNFLGDKSSLCL